MSDSAKVRDWKCKASPGKVKGLDCKERRVLLDSCMQISCQEADARRQEISAPSALLYTARDRTGNFRFPIA